MKKIALIGAGTMGTALASALCRQIDPAEVAVTDKDMAKARELAERLGCAVAESNKDAADTAEFVVYCVKPQFLKPVLEETAPCFAEAAKRGEHRVIVSIVAGVPASAYVEAMGLDTSLISVLRILPNTACLVGKGFILIEEGTTYTPADEAEFRRLFQAAGGIDSLPASQFVAGSVLTSTSPAFFAMFANSLADGGVYNGLLRPQARRLALEGIRGTVELLLSADKHLEQLKDEVCSPAGPAMIGVKSLEDSGFRSSVINAVVTAYQRFGDMAKMAK